MRLILSLFLILLIVTLSVPLYNWNFDPNPKEIPSLSEIDIDYDGKLGTTSGYEIDRSDVFSKTLASRVVSVACPKGNRVCHAKALFKFVVKNFNYISDPINHEYIENPYTFYSSGGGDCESGTLFLASLMESVGIDAEVVIVPRHAFLRINLPEASFRHKEGDWVYMDWTSGKFGERRKNEYMSFIDV